jgi:hypothetical protein
MEHLISTQEKLENLTGYLPKMKYAAPQIILANTIKEVALRV